MIHIDKGFNNPLVFACESQAGRPVNEMKGIGSLKKVKQGGLLQANPKINGCISRVAMIVCAFMLFAYRGLFSDSLEKAPQWVVTLIIGMFEPYCSLRFTSRIAGYVSQIANRSFNFAVRDSEPDLEPSVIWASDDDNEYYGALELVYPLRFTISRGH